MDALTATVVLDCRRLLCPLPVIRVQDRIKDLSPGTCVRAVCTDPGVLEDVPAWCRVHGHEVLEAAVRDGDYVVVLRIGETRVHPAHAND